MAKYDAAQLQKMAAAGTAMPDMAYPVADSEDLSNAIHAVGRGGASHDAIRRHIIKRAKALNLMSQIPANWQPDGSMRSTDEPVGMVFRDLAEPIQFPGGDGLTLEGYCAVYNQRAQIMDHMGEYDEVIKPGAFKRSINAKTPYLLFQHGRHPFFGQFPLGKIETLREDAKGLFVRARLVDTAFTAPVRDAIRDGAITGMSVAMESPRGKATWSNDGGRKLRTVNEAKLFELGPVLGEAYANTTVAVRSVLGAMRVEYPDAFPEDDLDSRIAAEVARALEGLSNLSSEAAERAETEEAIRNITDTPEAPDLEEVTAEGPVEDVDRSPEPSTYHLRQQRARLLRVERNNIGRDLDGNDS